VLHQTHPNQTATTRVSLDFRAIPRALYVDGYVSPRSKTGRADNVLGGSYTDTASERVWRAGRAAAAVAAGLSDPSGDEHTTMAAVVAAGIVESALRRAAAVEAAMANAGQLEEAVGALGMP
jgi:hypothetical protein